MSNSKKLSVVIAACLVFLTLCSVFFVVSIKQEAERKIPIYNRHLEALEADAKQMDLLYYKDVPETDPTYQRFKSDAKIHADAAEVLSHSIRTNPYFWSDYQNGRENSARPMLYREKLQGGFLLFIKPK